MSELSEIDIQSIVSVDSSDSEIAEYLLSQVSSLSSLPFPLSPSTLPPFPFLSYFLGYPFSSGLLRRLLAFFCNVL